MLTLILRLSPALAKQVARAADRLEMSHKDVGKTALRLFLRAGVRESTTPKVKA